MYTFNSFNDSMCRNSVDNGRHSTAPRAPGPTVRPPSRRAKRSLNDSTTPDLFEHYDLKKSIDITFWFQDVLHYLTLYLTRSFIFLEFMVLYLASVVRLRVKCKCDYGVLVFVSTSRTRTYSDTDTDLQLGCNTSCVSHISEALRLPTPPPKPWASLCWGLNKAPMETWLKRLQDCWHQPATNKW